MMDFSSTPWRALLFDMDGTLVDNMAYHAQTWRQFFGSKGFPWANDDAAIWERTHGTIEEIVRRIFGEHLTDEEVAQLGAEKEGLYRELYLPHIAPIAGLDAVIDAARDSGLKLGLGTAGGAPNIAFVLDELQLRPYFGAIVGGEDVSRGKPHPEVYLKTAARLKVAPEACLVFEDTAVGVRSAQRAGMACVALTTTRPAEEFARYPNVVQVIADYTELDLAQLTASV